MKVFSKLTSVFLAVCLIMALPLQVLAAEYDLAAGSVTITANEGSPQTVTHGSNAAVEDAAPIIKQSNASTSNTITITGGGEANVTLQGVNINTSSGAAITVDAAAGTSANVTLQGNNTVQSGSGHAGVEVNAGASLTITEASTGSLTATGGSGGAGIGGSSGQSAGTITIESGSITSRGNDGGAGIGGGKGGSSGEINIEGGTVTSNVGSIWNGHISGAGIGSGHGADADKTDKITISGDDTKVTAWGSIGSAGIGSGNQGEFGTISIEGGTVFASSSNGGTGIGCGSGGSGGEINISGGNVEAKGANHGSYGPIQGGGAGIGGAAGTIGPAVTITGGTVKATGGNMYGIQANGVGSGTTATSNLPENVKIYGGKVFVNGVLQEIQPAPEVPETKPNPQPNPQPDAQTVSAPENADIPDFWASVNWKISQAEEGSTLTIDAGSFTYIPRYVIENAVSRNITLVIQWDGGDDITIKPTDVIDLTRSSIPLKDLA